jgi:hypothetical protein
VDSTVGGLSRIVQSFRVSINAKGGDCWHVYRQSVLAIDGKNNDNDDMFTCKNNNEPNLERPEDEKGRMCQVGTISILERHR